MEFNHTKDDKAYLRPGTSGEEQQLSKEDFSLVTVRPKYYVGSSGSVWASDFMLLRYERPDLYEIPDDDQYRYYSLMTRLILASLKDPLQNFLQTNLKPGVLKVTKKDNCAFRTYEVLRKQLVQSSDRSKVVFDKVTSEEKKNILVLLEEQSKHLRNILGDIQSVLEKKFVVQEKLWEHFETAVDYIKDILKNIQYYTVPPVRPRLIEFTDAGPGVGCNNYEVKYRDQELAWLHNSSLRIRVHLATDNQGQNEAERVNAYIGDALADGTALKSNYYDKYHGLSPDDISKMTEDELTEHEAKMIQMNAWCIVDDVVGKIHDEPGPGGCYMQAFKTREPDEQFFYNTEYLNKWRKACQRVRTTLPGHEYFSAVEKSMEKHHIGKLYFEMST